MTDILENQLRLCKEAREYAHGNNVILNKNLVAKFKEVDELHALIRAFRASVQATEACTDILLSSRADKADEAAKLMNEMYEARDALFEVVK